jgi:hypothetical protein
VPNTTINGFPYPANTDAPTGPLQIQNLANAVDTRAVPRFSTTTARNAAITTPVDGQMCTVGGYPMFYRTGQWRGIVSTSATQQTFFNTTIFDGTETGVATLTISDPGWPYILDVSANVMVAATAGCYVNVRVRLDTIGGVVVSQDAVRSGALPAGEIMMIPLGVFPTGTLTGSHSLIVAVRRTLGTGNWNVPAGGSILNATVRPSFA